ncbi:uncharacterized protein LOC105640215 isoform X2 [Jatropha curcas]|uniref:uncharacterized protein LOC105640215 isoform X2 n=1 Tax=Jatropha curcas TaxID=180498 RepID=UPI0009D67486|nr:uncharacterized protein LOC105640215 isoform X2 [Jatropha curcas]
MGKKPSASKFAQKSNKDGEVQPESLNPTLEKVELQKANSSTKSSGKRVKKTPAKVRRSDRLQNAVTSTENQDIECIIEAITVSESEKEDEPVDEELPETNLNEKHLYKKVDYIIRLLEAQQKTIDSLNSRATEKTFFSKGPSFGDVKYKSLYIDSQKKIQVLMEENRQLSKKLEYALGKIEVYEKGNDLVSEVLGKFKDELKDVLLLSSFTRPTEATAERDLECKTVKRKRLDREK